ncbi:MAG: DUF664 domain-containing protein [Moraxellaceae bacterium]|nr:MAG: DUF664 domain-containing protein [Moraxellaceae bacterium]
MDKEKLAHPLLVQQYELVKSARATLLDFCVEISQQDFLTLESSFGRGSIRNLLTHIANVYEFWIVENVAKRAIDVRPFSAVKNIADARNYFEKINQTVDIFIAEYSEKLHEKICVNLNDHEITTSPFEVFTHLITHEFHHKGQILSLSRHLGYTPIDTDIIR